LVAPSAGLCLVAGAASPAQAAFVKYVVTAVDVDHEGVALTVYTVAARFDGAADTVLLAFQLKSDKPENFAGFWHKDALSAPSEDAPPALRQDAGTWSPSQVLQPRVNRSCDSFLTIGGEPGVRDATMADPSWSKPPKKPATVEGQPTDGASFDIRGWSRPDLPTRGLAGWFIAGAQGSSAGRVGKSPAYEIAGRPTLENPATDVRLAQFVLSRGHEPRSFELTVAFNDGSPEAKRELASGTFLLGLPKQAEGEAADTR